MVLMKEKLFLATTLACGMSASAFAADLPSRKAPPVYVPPAPVSLWTGFYAGLNAGGAFGAGSSLSSTGGDLYDDFAPAAAGAAGALGATAYGVGGLNNSGFIGGGQVGYNYQFGQRFVVGVEADIQGLAGSSGNVSFMGGSPDPAGSPASMVTTGQIQGSLDYLGTVRGRAGFLITPTLLIYGTGGLAYGGTNLSASYSSGDLAGLYGPGFGSSSYSDTLVGWTVGGGIEWMFLPNWSAKLEYLYFDLGTATTNTVVAGINNGTGAIGYAFGTSTSARFNGNLVRAGVNYHFNFGAPAPVLAKF
jgi:outer membrane immunogenic protein